MSYRLLATAALAVPLTLTAGAARADCLWGIGMAERDLLSIERAAPLAADRTLPLGPGATAWISGADEDFADRAMLAFGTNGGRDEEGQIDAAALEGEIARAHDRLALARLQVGIGDMEGCAEALDQAQEAIDGARRAFR